MKIAAFIRLIPREALIWLTGLVLLACIHPVSNNHFTVCPLALLDFDFCPGCGLGRAVSLLLHGHWQESFTMHPLGIPALLILVYRIISLTLTHIRYHGKNY